MNRMKVISFSTIAVLVFFLAYMAIGASKEVNITVSTEPIVLQIEPIEETPSAPKIIVIEEKEAEPVIVKKSAPYDSIPLEDEYQLYIEDWCETLGIDYWLVMALIESESSFNHDAVGDNGKSIGLFQINKCWHEYLKENYELDVFDHFDNIKAGLYIFTTLLDKYPTELAVQCYKAGESKGNSMYEEGRVLPGARAVVARAEEMKNAATE